jgi:hypothetical protein
MKPRGFMGSCHYHPLIVHYLQVMQHGAIQLLEALI